MSTEHRPLRPGDVYQDPEGETYHVLYQSGGVALSGALRVYRASTGAWRGSWPEPGWKLILKAPRPAVQPGEIWRDRDGQLWYISGDWALSTPSMARLARNVDFADRVFDPASVA